MIWKDYGKMYEKIWKIWSLTVGILKPAPLRRTTVRGYNSLSVSLLAKGMMKRRRIEKRNFQYFVPLYLFSLFVFNFSSSTSPFFHSSFSSDSNYTTPPRSSSSYFSLFHLLFLPFSSFPSSISSFSSPSFPVSRSLMLHNSIEGLLYYCTYKCFFRTPHASTAQVLSFME